MARPKREHVEFRLKKRNRDGIWGVEWTEGGKPKRLSFGTRDRREADRQYAQFIAGLDNPAPPASAGVEAVLASYETAKEKTVRSPGAIKAAIKALYPFFNGVEPGQITSGTLERYRDARFAAGRKPGTVAREIQTLRAALRWAKAAGWPITLTDMPMPVSTPPPRDRWLTKTEAGKLIDGCESLHVETFVIIGLSTAARSGAILDLTWDRVDLESGRIDFGPGHGNKRRVVAPMNERCKAALTEAFNMRGSDHVIEWRGKQVKSIKTGFREARRRAGLDKNVTPHILRHTSATWMAQAAVPMARIAALLGDREEVVERVYAKHHPDFLKDAVDALDF